MRSKRWLLLGILLAGALSLVSATQSWAVISFVDGAAAFGRLDLTGQQISPSLSPVAIASLAAALALTIAGPIFRRVLGGLVALFGMGIALIGAGSALDPWQGASSRIAEATGISGGDQRAVVSEISGTSWPMLTAVLGVALLICGILVLLFSGRWRAAGRKYGGGEDRATAQRAAAEPDRISDWDAQNDGDDPSEAGR